MPLPVSLLFFITFSLVAGTPVLADGAPTAAGDPLDGLRFQGITGEQGKGEHHEDTITFKDGQFRSLDCENWGFGPAPYRVWKEGGTYHFTATLLSADRGRLIWRGTVTDGTAEATFRWLHERWYWDIDRRYWFRGKRLSADKKPSS